MREPTTKKPYTVAAMRHGGTHLITPIVRALTGKTVYSPKGQISLECEPSATVIVFLRDPRNRLVSAFRFKHPSCSTWNTGELDRQLAAFATREKRPGEFNHIDFMRHWANRWVRWPRALTVRFEDLTDRTRGVLEVQRIRNFLDVRSANPEAVYDSVFGKSGTWTGRHSDYREWFGPVTWQAWRENYGENILFKMGYPP